LRKRERSSEPHSPSTGGFYLSASFSVDTEMPPDNQNRSPRQRLPTDLEGRFGKIGIPAVAAAARYSSERKRAGPSIKDAGGGAAEKERSKPPKD
jgi:hypothetical protein